MPFRGLVFLVEGDDDSRFIEQIALPCLDDRYLDIRIVEWAQVKDPKVDALIYSFREMGYDIVFLGDRDEAVCISGRKEELLQRFSCLKDCEIVITVPEIEAWYIAGAGRSAFMPLPPWALYNTDRVYKEVFDRCLVSKDDSRIAVMRSILGEYSLTDGMKRSESLRYFVERCRIRKRDSESR